MTHIPVFIQVIAIIAACVVPTITLIGLFVRVGGLLSELTTMRMELHGLRKSVTDMNALVTELKAWRDTTLVYEQDMVKRITRVEDLMFGGK